MRLRIKVTTAEAITNTITPRKADTILSARVTQIIKTHDLIKAWRVEF
jgi:hypothetical protein